MRDTNTNGSAVLFTEWFGRVSESGSPGKEFRGRVAGEEV